MADSHTVIVEGLRSPFGKLGGGLSSLPAVDIAAPLIKELLQRCNVAGSSIDEVVLGQVLQAGCGQIPSRQAALRAGLPVTCESTTVNKVCASGMRAITVAHSRLLNGDGEIFIAGGMESMSQAPYLIAANTARFGKRIGDAQLEDSMLKDGLQCPVNNVPMLAYGVQNAEEFGISRQEQDEWALRSHEKAIAAQKSGRFTQEILSFEICQGKKNFTVEADESPRSDTSLAALAALKPAYSPQGSVTAGNAPSVNDGAAILLLMNEKKAKDLGLKPLAKILSTASVAQDVPYLATVPALAAQKALAKTGLSVAEIGLVEINEAFAVVALHSAKMLGIKKDILNVNGGAIALGHPIGASGARIVLTLAKEMKLRGVKYGVAAICSGTAQGDSIILSREGLE